MSRRILIKGGRVIGAASPTADVLVEGTLIRAIAPEIAADDVEIIDAHGMIVMPGFVDTHRHLWQTAIRGVAADWSLVEYIRNIRLGYATSYRPEDVYVSNYIGALEAIDAGITAVCDFCHIIRSPDHTRAAVDGLRDAGIRAHFYQGFYDIPEQTPVFADHDSRLDHARATWRDRFSTATSDLISMGVALTEFGLVPMDSTRAEVAVAREFGLPITMHMGTLSTPDGVSKLRQAGLLGPDMLHVHCNASSDEELRQIADSGGQVSITPETELQMGMGIPITNRALAAGLKPTFGIDIVSDCSGDMFAQMRLALQTARAIDNERILQTGKMPVSIDLTVRDAFDFATIHGAAAMGQQDKIGSLAPGKRADIVLLAMDGVHHMPPSLDPLATIVLQARPSDVRTVMIDGVIRKRDGKLMGVDLPALGQRALASSAHLARAFETAAARTASSPTATTYAGAVSNAT
ncbi:amidohydrolase family protein [Roseiarcaceae bacterium H3SJ34-1]|uniref:amidohydrolase family protein n=1 Tax=Terripilifer ovatus TaxID=3032367 RepID=UPI003AB9AE4F|nr:amidohydrolase family protein [Roseiarcaceae bacterium H3SJ34-1]